MRIRLLPVRRVALDTSRSPRRSIVKVIGVGFGRTGTMSLKAALERLGAGPCFHMIDLIMGEQKGARPAVLGADRRRRAGRLARGLRRLGVDRRLAGARRAGARSATPSRTRPVLLNVREFEGWYASVENTILAAQARGPQPARWSPDANRPPPDPALWGVIDETDLAGRLPGPLRGQGVGAARCTTTASPRSRRRSRPDRLTVWELGVGRLGAARRDARRRRAGRAVPAPARHERVPLRVRAAGARVAVAAQ